MTWYRPCASSCSTSCAPQTETGHSEGMKRSRWSRRSSRCSASTRWFLGTDCVKPKQLAKPQMQSALDAGMNRENAMRYQILYHFLASARYGLRKFAVYYSSISFFQSTPCSGVGEPHGELL